MLCNGLWSFNVWASGSSLDLPLNNGGDDLRWGLSTVRVPPLDNFLDDLLLNDLLLGWGNFLGNLFHAIQGVVILIVTFDQRWLLGVWLVLVGKGDRSGFIVIWVMLVWMGRYYWHRDGFHDNWGTTPSATSIGWALSCHLFLLGCIWNLIIECLDVTRRSLRANLEWGRCLLLGSPDELAASLLIIQRFIEIMVFISVFWPRHRWGQEIWPWSTLLLAWFIKVHVNRGVIVIDDAYSRCVSIITALWMSQRASCTSFLHVFKSLLLLLLRLIILDEQLGRWSSHAGPCVHICNWIFNLNIPHDLVLKGLVLASYACLARVLSALLRPVIIDHRLLGPLCHAFYPREVLVYCFVPAACAQISAPRFRGLWVVFIECIIHFLIYNTSLGHFLISSINFGRSTEASLRRFRNLVLSLTVIPRFAKAASCSLWKVWVSNSMAERP